MVGRQRKGVENRDERDHHLLFERHRPRKFSRAFAIPVKCAVVPFIQ